MIKKIQSLLGAEADDLLNHKCKGFPKESLHLPGPDFIDRVWVMSDRARGCLRSLASLFGHGRLAGTGYLSILPVDQGVEHSAARLLCPQPHLFRPGEHRQAGHGRGLQRAWPPPSGCWARWPGNTPTRSPSSSRSTTTRCCTYPQFLRPDPVRPGGAGLRPGGGGGGGDHLLRLPGVPPPDPGDQPRPSSWPTNWAWPASSGATCATRPSRPEQGDFHAAADLTGQANYLGVTIEADIVKQKLAENNGGYKAVPKFGKTSDLVYTKLAAQPPHRPAAATRWPTASWAGPG